MSWLAPLQERYQALPSRDQQILKIALPIIVLLVAYLLIVRPIFNYHTQAIAELEVVTDDYFWLRGQKPVARSQCPTYSINAIGDSYIAELAKKLQLKLTVSAQGDDRAIVSITALDGRAVLRFIESAACAGAVVDAIQFRRADVSKQAVTGKIQFNIAGVTG